ncbi:MAG: hypothetical protein AB7T06_06960 [Kofleriaceae bacterium]
MRSKVRVGFPIDEPMRSEHGERVVRPEPNVLDTYDPEDDVDRGPHVDRVGIISVDDFEPDGTDDPPPRLLHDHGGQLLFARTSYFARFRWHGP